MCFVSKAVDPNSISSHKKWRSQRGAVSQHKLEKPAVIKWDSVLLPTLSLKYKTMDNSLQIANIKRMIGQLEIRIGIAQIGDAVSDFSSTKGTFVDFTKALSILGVPVAQLDTNYYFTNWDNWLKVIATINPILQSIPWKADVSDCDKRADFVIGWVAELFELNTIRPLLCDVFRVSDGQYAYTHYNNIIADDSGNIYIWDVDNGDGLFGKITSNTPIIGNCKYIPKKVC